MECPDLGFAGGPNQDICRFWQTGQNGPKWSKIIQKKGQNFFPISTSPKKSDFPYINFQKKKKKRTKKSTNIQVKREPSKNIEDFFFAPQAFFFFWFNNIQKKIQKISKKKTKKKYPEKM